MAMTAQIHRIRAGPEGTATGVFSALGVTHACPKEEKRVSVASVHKAQVRDLNQGTLPWDKTESV